MAAYVFVVVGDMAGRHIGVDFGDVRIGFVIPSAVLIFALSTFYGNRNWTLGIGASMLVPVFIYLVFTKFLLQPLPWSPLTEWFYQEVLALLN
jgi:magnesium-transporting ATPase (P-type)